MITNKKIFLDNRRPHSEGENIREQSALTANPAMLDGSSRPGIQLHYFLSAAN
jgi:hypothetical protein